MRHSTLLLSALLGIGLTACQDSPSATASNSDNSGSFAMRVPAAVVTAGTGIVDSVSLRVVPLNAPASAITKTWPLKEEELLFPSLPATRCSVYVTLPKKDKSGTAYVGAALVDIRPGRTTQADINLTQTTGSLSLNLKIDAYNNNTSAPKVSPVAGSYINSVTVTLSHPVAGTVIQYRLENATTGATAAWSTYSAALPLTQSSVLFTRAINGTDTGAIQVSNYFLSYSKTLNDFETAYSNTIGWNGSVFIGTLSAAGTISGKRLTPGSFGNASARLDFVISGSSDANATSGRANVNAKFIAPSGIVWSNMRTLRLRMRSNVKRNIKVLLNSIAIGYPSSDAGFGWGAVVTVTPEPADLSSFYEFTIRPSDFKLTKRAGDLNPPTLDNALSKANGIQLAISCADASATSCSQESGSLEVDDIIVDWN